MRRWRAIAFALACALALGNASPARAEDDPDPAASEGSGESEEPEASEAPESGEIQEAEPASEAPPDPDVLFAPPIDFDPSVCVDPVPDPPPAAATAVVLARARLAAVRGQDAEALRLLGQALDGASLTPAHADLLAWRAALQVRAGDLAAAEKDLRRLLTLAPDDAAARRDLGLVRLARDKLMWAMRDLAAVVEAAPGDARAQYALGLALLRGESFREADAALDRAGELAPELRSRTEYYRGVAAYREGDLERARQRFSQVGGQAGELGEAAEAFLDAVYREQGGRPLLTASAAIGGQYDSNPVLDPEGTGQALGHHAAALTFHGGLAISPLPPGRHRLTGTAEVNLTRYGDRNADDFDHTGFAGTAEYAYGFDWLGQAHAVEAAYLFRTSLLGGGPRAERDELYVFSESHAGRVGWRMAVADLGVTRLTYEARGAMYAHLGRDAVGHHVTLSQSVFLLDERLKLYLRFSARVDDAAASAYDLYAVGPFVGFATRPFWDLDLFGWFAYQREAHPDSKEYWKSTEHRSDDVLRAAVGLSRTFNGVFRLSLSWTHTEHLSTLAQFEYARDVVSFSGGLQY